MTEASLPTDLHEPQVISLAGAAKPDTASTPFPVLLSHATCYQSSTTGSYSWFSSSSLIVRAKQAGKSLPRPTRPSNVSPTSKCNRRGLINVFLDDMLWRAGSSHGVGLPSPNKLNGSSRVQSIATNCLHINLARVAHRVVLAGFRLRLRTRRAAMRRTPGRS